MIIENSPKFFFPISVTWQLCHSFHVFIESLHLCVTTSLSKAMAMLFQKDPSFFTLSPFILALLLAMLWLNYHIWIVFLMTFLRLQTPWQAFLKHSNYHIIVLLLILVIIYVNCYFFFVWHSLDLSWHTLSEKGNIMGILGQSVLFHCYSTLPLLKE